MAASNTADRIPLRIDASRALRGSGALRGAENAGTGAAAGVLEGHRDAYYASPSPSGESASHRSTRRARRLRSAPFSTLRIGYKP